MDCRTWEQFKADNIGKAFIQDGEFCKDFERAGSNADVRKILDAEDVPEWKKTGFNGCWSCMKIFTCDKLDIARFMNKE